MPSIGPQLPPEFQKRKRSDHDDDDDSDSSTGPALPKPETTNSPPSAKRTRVLGPALPPTQLNERPGSPNEEQEDSESDDDGFGPSLPSASSGTRDPVRSSIGPSMPPSTRTEPAKRDEWMTLAPDSGDWSSRVDPTKLKNRKFNTGRGSKGPAQKPSNGGDSSWHETPEQKQERLKREVMGINESATTGRASKAKTGDDSHNDATAQRLKEYTDAQRGPSLYSSHASAQEKPLDDDPSARAFDREKDIGSGSAISATQRRDMVKKATDFSSRFEKAKYL